MNEDILTSANNSTRKALDKLLESLIVDKTINYNDILVGDKKRILVKEFGMVKTMTFLLLMNMENKLKERLT